jgi:hypothetical protein
MIFTTKTQVKWYPAGVYRYLAVVESVLGWLLMALFLATLGRNHDTIALWWQRYLVRIS